MQEACWRDLLDKTLRSQRTLPLLYKAQRVDRMVDAMEYASAMNVSLLLATLEINARPKREFLD